MKTLDEHNDDEAAAREELREYMRNAGVLCNKCGEQMIYSDPDMILTSDPPCRAVYCEHCGATGLKTC